MYEECQKLFSQVDIAIFCAAVDDYTSKIPYEIKIKKIENEIIMEFLKNVNTAYEFGRVKTSQQKSIGLALETNNVLDNALNKLQEKL